MRLNIGAATVRGHETILCAAPPQCSTYYILSPKPCCPKALFSLNHALFLAFGVTATSFEAVVVQCRRELRGVASWFFFMVRGLESRFLNSWVRLDIFFFCCWECFFAFVSVTCMVYFGCWRRRSIASGSVPPRCTTDALLRAGECGCGHSCGCGLQTSSRRGRHGEPRRGCDRVHDCGPAP